MEKSTPHCNLSVVKCLLEAGKVRTTLTALRDATALGFDFDEIVDVVMALTMRDFYKSMTSHTDHTVWQDVYRPNTRAGELYLKLSVTNDVLIVSFKELNI